MGGGEIVMFGFIADLTHYKFTDWTKKLELTHHIDCQDADEYLPKDCKINNIK